MKRLILFIIILGSLSGYSQSIDKLENELSYFIGGQKYRDKVQIARKLLKIDPLNFKAVNFIYDYYRENKIDSIQLFFNELLYRNENKTAVYMLGAQLVSYYDWYNYKNSSEERIKLLKSALEYDRNNKDAIYYLAETYYTDFIRPFYLERDSPFHTGDHLKDSVFMEDRRQERKAFFDHSADSALKYLNLSWQLDIKRRGLTYFPLRQLNCYLKMDECNVFNLSNIPTNVKYYIPSYYFMNLSTGWEYDLSYDYLSKAQLSDWQTYRFSQSLHKLNESSIYYKNNNKEIDKYRFTWLRSFHVPITISIEKTSNKIKLSWKKGNKSGVVRKKGSKRISKQQWSKFIKLIEESNFENLPNEKYVPMTDGASWTLEYKSDNGFKIHRTNFPENSIKNACLYLLELSGLKIKKRNIY